MDEKGWNKTKECLPKGCLERTENDTREKRRERIMAGMIREGKGNRNRVGEERDNDGKGERGGEEKKSNGRCL